MDQAATTTRRGLRAPTQQRLLLLSVGVVAALVVVRYVSLAALNDQVDFQVYRAGGGALLHGHDLYELRVPPFGLKFTYPPASALVFLPFSWVPLRVGEVAWMVGNLVALWFVVTMSLRRYGPPTWATHRVLPLALVVAVAVSDPIRVGMEQGQVNILLALLVVADLSGALPRLPRGIMIGIAAALKLTPLFLIAYLLVVRRFRDAAWAAGTFVAVLAGCFVIAPGASTDYWVHGLFVDPSRVGGVAFISNQSVNGLVVRLAGSPTGGKAFWGVAALLVTAAVLWAARRAAPARPWLAEALAMGGMLAVSPVSWVHHWIFVLPLLLAAFRLGWAPGRRAPATLASALSVALLVRLVWVVPNEHGAEYHQTPWEFVVGNAYLLGLLALLASVVLDVRRPARAPAALP
jgi:alpha-1,2-mannosyltransferase